MGQSIIANATNALEYTTVSEPAHSVFPTHIIPQSPHIEYIMYVLVFYEWFAYPWN